MGSQCLITANREEAKIFSFENGKLEFIKKFENPDGAKRNREFQTDHAGTKNGGVGRDGAHGVGGNKDPKTDVEIAFTKYLAKTLPQELSALKFTEVIIAAEPKFQGLLKTEIKSHSPKTLVTWLLEDWNNLPNAKIEHLLKNY